MVWEAVSREIVPHNGLARSTCTQPRSNEGPPISKTGRAGPDFTSVCELLGLSVDEEASIGLDGDFDGESLLVIAPPPPTMPHLAEPDFLDDVAAQLARNQPGLLDFERRPSKKAFRNSATSALV